MKDGFYIVLFKGEQTIARCINESFTMCGNVNLYDLEDFDYVQEIELWRF